MKLAAALIYWVIVPIWTTVLITVVVNYFRNPRAFGTTRLLLTVIAIDTSRNIVENIYFGFYFGAKLSLFPSAIAEVLGNPYLLIIPKLANVAAGSVVMILLLRRWLPNALGERRRADQAIGELKEIAALDGMTGLLNKSHFEANATVELERSRRYKRPLSLVLADIDVFKSINDRFGHDVGDRVIMQIATALQDQKRASDMVARIGGEEFALLLPETELEGACAVAERLRQVISRQVLALPDANLAVTISVGVCQAQTDGTLKQLLKQADVALYAAKRDGRNRVRTYPAANAQATIQIEAAPI